MTLAAPAARPDAALQVAAARATGVLGTPRDAAFDRLVFIAAQLFRAPIATLSLLDGESIWYKSGVGVAWQTLPRAVAFCGTAVAQCSPMLVQDTLLDPRFQANPLVSGPPGVRFYAGAQVMAPEGLRGEGGAGPLPVGVLCVMDRQRRTVGAGQMARLVQLAAEATALLASYGAAAGGGLA